jgi:hypothetical protein
MQIVLLIPFAKYEYPRDLIEGCHVVHTLCCLAPQLLNF